jgi:hypothetical protein
MAKDDEEEDGEEEDRTGEGEVEQVSGSLRYLYFGACLGCRKFQHDE